MSTTRPRHLAHAGLLLALLSPAATAAPALEAIVYVEYDAAAPLDPTKSYGCLADIRLGSGSAATRQLTCIRQVPLAELCGTDANGQLPADCPFIPGSPGAGSPPTAAQIRSLADALLEHFQGHQPKLNLASQRLSQGGREAYEMNWQPGAPGASPSIGAWNEASAAERNVQPTALQVDDPEPADSRYGNTDWTNPAADPAEWNALLSSATLDHVYAASRNLLATPSEPDPPAAAVAARAAAEVARCREASLDLLRSDIEFHISAAAGVAAQRPAGSVGADCVADPGSPPPPTPPPPPTFTACDGSLHSSQAAADAVDCTTYTACDDSEHDTQSAADAVTCTADPDPDPETEQTKTCWDGSTVGISESCPTEPTYTACDSSTHSSQAAADAVDCSPPETYTACDDSVHDTQAAADAVDCTTYTACDSSTHSSQAAADAVDCSPPETYTACDDSVHDTQAAADAVDCTTYTACDSSTHSSQAAADAVDCSPPETYTACDDSVHDTQAAADAVDCTPETYTACDGSPHSSQAAADAVTCTYDPDPDDLNECQGGDECPYSDSESGFLGWF